MGDKKSRQIISRARRTNPEAIIAAVGCYSQMAPKEVSEIPGVDVVLGTRNKGDVVYYVNKAKDEGQPQVHVQPVLQNKKFEDLKIEDYQDKTRAFLKIQDGCNRFCSYCLIPFARGAVCSKSPEKVMSEVRELSKNGFKEIILSGVHTASYGVDLEGNWDLVKLLEEINKIDGIERIRIGSIDPTFFSEGVIERIVTLEKMCPHFHLSLQSGCDSTLKRMNRHYTTSDYRVVVKNLRKYMPNVSITTDIIVGFPGETEKEFNTTYEFLKDIKLSKMHIFKYSPRKGTKAADMEFQVDGNLKEVRSNQLIKLNAENEKAYMEKFLNKTEKVLYEEELKGKENHYIGYTSNYIKVISYSAKENLDGKILATKLIAVEAENMLGEI